MREWLGDFAPAVPFLLMWVAGILVSLEDRSRTRRRLIDAGWTEAVVNRSIHGRGWYFPNARDKTLRRANLWLTLRRFLYALSVMGGWLVMLAMLAT